MARVALSCAAILTCAVAARAACDPGALPKEVPRGWAEYTDWSCRCRFYVPESPAALPAPVAWVPCPPNPTGLDCRVMVADWTAGDVPIALNPRIGRDGDGRAVLDFTRDATDTKVPHTLHLVADVDGPIRSAMLKLWTGESVNAPDCHLVNEAINEGRYVRVPRGKVSSAGSAELQGALGGAVDDLRPAALVRPSAEGSFAAESRFKESWACSASRLARIGSALAVYRWDMSEEMLVTSETLDPEHLRPSQLVMTGDVLFWTSADASRSGINVWDPAHGTRPFIRFIGDASRGAGNLGTDGVDLVWSYGEGKRPEDAIHPVRSIMTAPFTDDPTALRPKRLRSQPSPGIAEREWQVGCGHAAHAAGGGAILVVRLADGVSWLVSSAPPAVKLQRPIGLTCEDLFALGQIGGRWNVARIRLSSLGTGTPPD